MLKHWYIFSVRSSEIYSTGEVSFHAEGASDQYFLGTQYLLPRWPTLSISTSILVLFHISSMIVGREEVLFAAPTLKWGSICCEANLKLLKYSLPLESSRLLSLSQCNVGKLLLFWEIILHQNLTTNTKKYNIQTFILCAIGTQWILRGGHMQTFDGLQMATVEEQKKSWLARLADTFLISFLCLSKF